MNLYDIGEEHVMMAAAVVKNIYVPLRFAEKQVAKLIRFVT